jgi:hypothetical protein
MHEKNNQLEKLFNEKLTNKLCGVLLPAKTEDLERKFHICFSSFESDPKKISENIDTETGVAGWTLQYIPFKPERAKFKKHIVVEEKEMEFEGRKGTVYYVGVMVDFRDYKITEGREIECNFKNQNLKWVRVGPTIEEYQTIVENQRAHEKLSERLISTNNEKVDEILREIALPSIEDYNVTIGKEHIEPLLDYFSQQENEHAKNLFENLLELKNLKSDIE